MERWRVTLFGRLRCERADDSENEAEANAETDAEGDTQGSLEEIGSVRKGNGRPAGRPKGALLGLLALYPGKTFRRDDLIAELDWSERDEGGRNRLRVELSVLKKSLEAGLPPDSILELSRDTVRLRSDAVTTDAANFDDLYREFERTGSFPALQAALDLYAGGGELLTGYDFPRLTLERERYRRRFDDGLRVLIAHHEETGDPLTALQYALTAWYLAPGDGEIGEAARRLTLTVAGDRSAREKWARLHALFADDLPEDLGRVGAVLSDALPAKKQGKSKTPKKAGPKIERPRTLRQAIGERIATLSRTDRQAVRRLTVFTGSFLPEAAGYILRVPDVGPLLDRLVAAEIIVAERERLRVSPVFYPYLREGHDQRDRELRQRHLARWVRHRLREAYHWSGHDNAQNHDVHLRWVCLRVAPEWENICGVVEENLYAPETGRREDNRRFRFGVRVGWPYINAAIVRGEILRHAAWFLEAVRQFDRLRSGDPVLDLGICAYYVTIYPTDSTVTQELKERTQQEIARRNLLPISVAELVESNARGIHNYLRLVSYASALETDASPLALIQSLRSLIETARCSRLEPQRDQYLHGIGNQICHQAYLAHTASSIDASSLGRALFSLGLPLVIGARERCEHSAKFAEFLITRGATREAEEIFEAARSEWESLRGDAYHPEFGVRYGIFLHHIGQCGDAEAVFDQAMEVVSLTDPLNITGAAGEFLPLVEALFRSAGHLAVTRGRFSHAVMNLRMAREMSLSRNDRQSASDGNRGLALVSLRRGELAPAREGLREALRVWEEQDHPRWRSVFAIHLAEVAFYLRDWDDVSRWLDETETQAARTVAPTSTAGGAYWRARTLHHTGDADGARAHYQDALTRQDRYCGVRHLIPTAEGVAETLAASEPRLSLAILQRADGERERCGIPVPPVERPLRNRVLKSLEGAAAGSAPDLPDHFRDLCQYLTELV